MREKLTDKEVENAAPKAADWKLFDGAGLFLLIKVNGSKYWRLKYRVGGKERLLALGVYPKVSVKKARRERDVARALIDEGIDPIQHRRDLESQKEIDRGHTFEAVARAWADHMYGKWKQSHHDKVIASFETDVFPKLGTKPIKEIPLSDLRAVVKTVEKRGALEIARRVAFRINAVLEFAKENEYISDNKASGLSSIVKSRKVEHYAALEEKDLPDFLKRLAEFRGHPITALAVRMQLLTVVRGGELRGAKWEEFDLDEKLWRIPGERMKMGEPHVVPLSRQSLAVLESIRKLTGTRALLFPNRNRPDQPFSADTVNHAIARLGYKGKATGHGFRSTFSTILNERGLNGDWIERQLAHSERSAVRAAYNSAQYLEQRRGMMQLWGDFLDAKAKGETVKRLRLAKG